MEILKGPVGLVGLVIRERAILGLQKCTNLKLHGIFLGFLSQTV